MTPLVSIITPSFNQGRFIADTIESINQQTYSHIEHIVVDGGSTDDTLEILKTYSDRVKWISEPDKGQSDAVNKGWKMANGEILGWLNSDDVYLPHAVERAVQQLMKRDGGGMVFGNCVIIDEKGNELREGTAGNFGGDALYYPELASSPSAFFHKYLLKDAGYLNSSLHYAMDYEFWIRISKCSRIEYIPETFTKFRTHPSSKTQSHFWLHLREVMHEYYKNGGRIFSRVHVQYLIRIIWWTCPVILKQVIRRIVFGKAH